MRNSSRAAGRPGAFLSAPHFPPRCSQLQAPVARHEPRTRLLCRLGSDPDGSAACSAWFASEQFGLSLRRASERCHAVVGRPFGAQAAPPRRTLRTERRAHGPEKPSRQCSDGTVSSAVRGGQIGVGALRSGRASSHGAVASPVRRRSGKYCRRRLSARGPNSAFRYPAQPAKRRRIMLL